jgi:hypothetical protein
MIVTQVAGELLHHAYNGKRPLRLFGLSLGHLSPAADLEQGNLFEPQSNADHKEIDLLMDEIRNRFGANAISRANLLPIRIPSKINPCVLENYDWPFLWLKIIAGAAGSHINLLLDLLHP